jgi:hypothetical protein
MNTTTTMPFSKTDSNNSNTIMAIMMLKTQIPPICNYCGGGSPKRDGMRELQEGCSMHFMCELIHLIQPNSAMTDEQLAITEEFLI